jgi:hypothetical protein
MNRIQSEIRYDQNYKKIFSFFYYDFLIIGGKLWEFVNCAYEHYTFEGLLYL